MSNWRKLNLAMSGAVLCAAVDYLISGDAQLAILYAIIGACTLHTGWNTQSVAEKLNSPAITESGESK